MIDNAIIVEIDFPNEIDVDLGEAKFITAPARKVPQATPEIHISESGLITASATQEEGMVLAGTKSAELQMPTKSGEIIEPNKETQLAIRKGEYAVGDISVNPISDEYIKPSGTIEITENNKEYNVAEFKKAVAKIALVSKLPQVIDRTVTGITVEDLEGVTKIGNNAFASCEKLEQAILPNGITILGQNAFSSCSKMRTIVLPNTLTKINQNAFSSCRAIEDIDIPNSCTEIGAYAFLYCSGIKTIKIGSGITKIGLGTFNGCTGVISVTVEADEPPTIQSSSLSDIPFNCPIYVKQASVEKYKTATNWSNRADFIFPIGYVKPDNVIEAGTYKMITFYYPMGGYIVDWASQELIGKLTCDFSSVTDQDFTSIAMENEFDLRFYNNSALVANIVPNWNSDNTTKATIEEAQNVSQGFKTWWDECFIKE